MRIARFVFLAVAVIVIAQPVFACKDCYDDGSGDSYCALVVGDSWGCEWDDFGECFTPMILCNAPKVMETSLKIASVEVMHGPAFAQPSDVVRVATAQLPRSTVNDVQEAAQMDSGRLNE